MLWRHYRREVTHCELFASIEALITVTKDFFDRYNREPSGVDSLFGAHATGALTMYLADRRQLYPGRHNRP